MIQPSHLPEAFRPRPQDHAVVGARSLQEIEARFISDVLRRHAGNRVAAAKELGIHKTTLWRKIRQLGIAKPTV